MGQPKFKQKTFRGNTVFGFKLNLLNQQSEEEGDSRFIDL